MLKALTFIGSSPNRYSETTYYIELDGKRESCKTHLFPEVVVKLYKPEKLIAFATDEVLKDIHGHGYVAHLSSVCSTHGVDFESLRIPSGKSTSELWEIFDVYADAVDDGDEIVLDITHGFRSLPVLALPAIAYLQQVKNAVFKHILYGAFEARDPTKNETPIFDLTPFVSLLNWTNAVNVFQHSGDARPIAKLEGVSTIRASLTNLSDALLTNRTLEAQEAVGRLAGGLTHPRSLSRFPTQFHILTDQLKETYAGISVRKPEANPRESLTGQYAQIKWYIDNLHYLHAITLIREWLISWELLTGGSGSSNWLNEIERETAEGRLNSRFHAKPRSKLPLDKLWGACHDTRNDLAHCGMRDKGLRKSSTAIRGIENLFKAFEFFFTGLVKTGQLPPIR